MITFYITIGYESILALGQIRAKLGVKNPDDKAGRFHFETSFASRMTSSRSEKLSSIHEDMGVLAHLFPCVKNPDDKNWSIPLRNLFHG